MDNLLNYCETILIAWLAGLNFTILTGNPTIEETTHDVLSIKMKAIRREQHCRFKGVGAIIPASEQRRCPGSMGFIFGIL